MKSLVQKRQTVELGKNRRHFCGVTGTFKSMVIISAERRIFTLEVQRKRVTLKRPFYCTFADKNLMYWYWQWMSQLSHRDRRRRSATLLRNIHICELLVLKSICRSSMSHYYFHNLLQICIKFRRFVTHDYFIWTLLFQKIQAFLHMSQFSRNTIKPLENALGRHKTILDQVFMVELFLCILAWTWKIFIHFSSFLTKLISYR